MRFCLVLLFSSLCYITDAEERPNILFAFADDWGRYASIYQEVDGPGTINDLISTPNFDRVAREGVLFPNAFVNAPSCTPCRSSLVSGQYFFRTGLGAILQGAEWDSEIPVFPFLLRDSGYHIGKLYKVWGPGTPANAPFGGGDHGFEIPGGTNFNGFSQTVTRLTEGGKSIEVAKSELLEKVEREFDSFLTAQPEGDPFLFWFGPTNVHRKWIQGSGKELWGLDPDELKGKMPAFLPDVHTVREDIADYLGEAMAFDAALGVLIDRLEESGQLENTMIVVSGDHGAPGFPRGKCNLYDFGQAVPLAVRWGDGGGKNGRVVDDFVNLMDIAPTFLEAGETTIPDVMTGSSLLTTIRSESGGWVESARDHVVTGRERHVAEVREGNLPYPQRAIRTKDHLYIVNFEPERWPMGEPGPVADGETPSTDELTNNTFACYGDLDAGPTKAWMIENRDDPDYAEAYELGFGKRPERELYVLADDPDQVVNRAGVPELAEVEAELHDRLFKILTEAEDPRIIADPVPFEALPYTSSMKRRKK